MRVGPRVAGRGGAGRGGAGRGGAGRCLCTRQADGAHSARELVAERLLHAPLALRAHRVQRGLERVVQRAELVDAERAQRRGRRAQPLQLRLGRAAPRLLLLQVALQGAQQVARRDLVGLRGGVARGGAAATAARRAAAGGGGPAAS